MRMMEKYKLLFNGYFNWHVVDVNYGEVQTDV